MSNLFKSDANFSYEDFGYSYLKYLKLLPIKQLKLKQTVLRDIGLDERTKTLLRTIIAIATGMGMEVVAEEVETESQRQFLLNIGCTIFQGNLFGKPMPIEKFNSLVKQF